MEGEMQLWRCKCKLSAVTGPRDTSRGYGTFNAYRRLVRPQDKIDAKRVEALCYFIEER